MGVLRKIVIFRSTTTIFLAERLSMFQKKIMATGHFSGNLVSADPSVTYSERGRGQIPLSAWTTAADRHPYIFQQKCPNSPT